MQNKSRIKAIIINSSKVIAFFIMFCLVNMGLTFLLDDDANDFFRLTFYEMYHQEDNIDVLFLGSSHCFRSLVSEELDVIYEKNTFNAGSSSQKLDASYVILQEVGKNNELEEVYLELYYGMALESEYSQRTELGSTYTVSNNLKESFDKAIFLIKASGSDYYPNSFLLPRRYIGNLQFGIMYDIIKKKSESNYQNYEYIEVGTSVYIGQGFIGSENYIENGIVFMEQENQAIEDNIFKNDYINSLFQIIEYCKENNIQLILFSAPVTDFRLSNIEYDNYIEQVERLLQDTEIPYIDFNLCKEDFLNLEIKTDFYDEHHLNSSGAEKFSKAFAEIFANKNDPHEAVQVEGASNIYLPEEYFYSSYEEKFENLEDALLGVIITSEDAVYQIQSVMAGSVDTKYEIILENEVLAIKNDEYEKVIEELIFPVESDKFQLPEDYNGDIKLGITVDGEDIGRITISK
ncbi:MAG: hypothetical protein R3Y24_10870 [Eubacteriales bacterium]